MITARVRRPYVASINTPRSRASCMILLIGAESGLTIDTIRFAETMLPKPILINLMPKILLLLTHAGEIAYKSLYAIVVGLARRRNKTSTVNKDFMCEEKIGANWYGNYISKSNEREFP